LKEEKTQNGESLESTNQWQRIKVKISSFGDCKHLNFHRKVDSSQAMAIRYA
jgi:hypothetical protein